MTCHLPQQWRCLFLSVLRPYILTLVWLQFILWLSDNWHDPGQLHSWTMILELSLCHFHMNKERKMCHKFTASSVVGPASWLHFHKNGFSIRKICGCGNTLSAKSKLWRLYISVWPRLSQTQDSVNQTWVWAVFSSFSAEQFPRHWQNVVAICFLCVCFVSNV